MDARRNIKELNLTCECPAAAIYRVGIAFKTRLCVHGRFYFYDNPIKEVKDVWLRKHPHYYWYESGFGGKSFLYMSKNK